MIPRISFNALITLLILILSIPAFGQKKKKIQKPVADSEIVYHDIYHGNIVKGDDTLMTTLRLDHKLYYDMGTFVMDEVYKRPGPGGRTLANNSTGTWTVLKETMDDEDVTMIELDGTESVYFFLRKDDSTLQKLNAIKQEDTPVVNNLLSCRVIPGVYKKDTLTEREINMRRLSGRYVGKSPCADCNSITSTLKLQYKIHAKSGDYVLSDKYFGTKTGDLTTESKGRWSYVNKVVEGFGRSSVIVLETGIRGRELYYLVKRNGGIIRLDPEMKPVAGPIDQTMKRQ